MRKLSPAARLPFLLLAWAACEAPQTAFAQTERDRQQARELFEAAVAADGEGNHAAAARAFASSYELYPQPSTIRNLALQHETLRQGAAAHRAWRELLTRFGGAISATARTEASARMAALEPTLAQVMVTGPPPGARILVDGEQVGQAPLAEPLFFDPGTITFHAEAHGYLFGSITRQLRPGPNPNVVISYARADQSAQSSLPHDATQPPSAAEVQQRRSFWASPWPYVVGGAIVVGTVAAILGVTLSSDNEPPEADLSWRIR